jgi:hypothetical protein
MLYLAESEAQGWVQTLQEGPPPHQVALSQLPPRQGRAGSATSLLPPASPPWGRGPAGYSRGLGGCLMRMVKATSCPSVENRTENKRHGLVLSRLSSSSFSVNQYFSAYSYFPLFFFLGRTGFELRAHTFKAGILWLEPCPPFRFALVIFGDGGLLNYLPRLASNHDPPYLSLPNS